MTYIGQKKHCLQGRVCSDVAARLDFAQFQSLQNRNFSKKSARAMESYEKSFGIAQPDENAPSARLIEKI